jgi:hypothetical protein
MKFYGRLLLAIVLPFAVGCLFLLPVINSGNGYVAGFVFLPLFFLIVLLAAVLLLIGLIAIGVKGRSGLWWLPAGPMLLTGFFGLALTEKIFRVWGIS